MPINKAFLPLLLSSLLILPGQTQAAPRLTAAQRAHQARLANLANEAFMSIWMDSDLEEADVEWSVRKALDAGVSPNARDEYGDTLLNQAIENERESSVRILLKRGADVNLPSIKGNETPLMRAVHVAATGTNASRAQINILGYLLQRKPRINQRSNDGDTALLSAVSDAQSDLVSLLLKAGADFRLRDRQGQTPLKWASYTAPTGSVLMNGPIPTYMGVNKSKAALEALIAQQKEFEQMAIAQESRLPAAQRKQLAQERAASNQMARAEERRLTQGWAKCKRLLLQAGAKE